MLNQSDEIVAPHPPHILKHFYPLLEGYGELGNAYAFQQLVEDVCQWIEHNPVPWVGVSLNREALWQSCKEESLLEVLRVIYEYVGEGSRYWCCKSMANVHYLEMLRAHFPNAFFIHLYRDGRDVAVSFNKTLIGEKHFYYIAQQWKEEQKRALEFLDTYPVDQQYSIQYEELIDSPTHILQELCGLLRIPYRPTMLTYYHSTASKHTAASGNMWANVAQPILRNNREKFRLEASEEEVRIFEAIAGDTLLELGYPLAFPSIKQPHFSIEELNAFEQENQLRKERVKSTISSVELNRRHKRTLLKQTIIKRIAGLLV